MTQKLTDKQKMFCNAYIQDWNGANAAIAAGYSPNNARGSAYELMTKPHIKAYISKKMHDRIELADINAAFVLKELYECWNADVLDIIDLKNGCYKPMDEWPAIWRKMVTGMKVKETFTGFGMDREKVGEIVEVVMDHKLKFLELIGKHIEVGAFAQNINVSGKVEIFSHIKAAQERAAAGRQTVLGRGYEESEN